MPIGIKGFMKGYNWKEGRTVDRLGYVHIYNPEHPMAISKRYVLEHRLAMEKNLGRYLMPHEIVHHISGNVSDNRLENLILFPSQSEHRKHHVALLKKSQPIII